MSRQMLIIIGVLLFGSGIGVGLFIASGPGGSAALAKTSSGTTSSGFLADSNAAEHVNDNKILSDRIRDLEKELAEQKRVQNDATVAAGRIAFFNKYHDKVRMSAFDNHFEVTPEMAEILGLSKEEQQAISKHLVEIQNEIKKLDDANTTLLKQTANGVTYEVPIDPQGKVLKDQLGSMLSAAIGEDRAAFFMNYGDFSGYSDFGDFSQSKKDIEITWTPQNGSLQYTIKNLYYGPNGVSAITTTSANVLPPQYQKLLQGEPGP